ncbi:hypothetical protein ACYOEI_25085, partial [Singulisphaera rosea]
MKPPRQKLLPLCALSLICSAAMPASIAAAQDRPTASKKTKAAKEVAGERLSLDSAVAKALA